MPSATLQNQAEEMELAEALHLPSEPPPCRKRFTREEVERMLDLGLFEGQRCELIDGDLIDKMGQKPSSCILHSPHDDLLSGIF